MSEGILSAWRLPLVHRQSPCEELLRIHTISSSLPLVCPPRKALLHPGWPGAHTSLNSALSVEFRFKHCSIKFGACVTNLASLIVPQLEGVPSFINRHNHVHGSCVGKAFCARIGVTV